MTSPIRDLGRCSKIHNAKQGAALGENTDVDPTRTPDTAIQTDGEEDADEDDECLGLDGDYDETTSVTPSFYEHKYERGRRYQARNRSYPVPNDVMEQNREDLKHTMLMKATDEKLFYAPIGDNPQKIVDIGTGTGIWAIEAGDKYPSAQVCGIDLSPIQPLWVPPNVTFLVDDCTIEWLDKDIDLAHFRFMAVILKDVPTVLRHAYRNLRSGGWVEFQELHGLPFCDDDTMSDNDPFKRLYELAGHAYGKLGLDTMVAANMEPLLRDAGFENIQCETKKIPIGGWAKDKDMRLLGLYQKVAVLEFISTFAGRPFEAMGMSREKAEMEVALARKALENENVHRYFKYYFWYAQKPGKGKTAVEG